MDFGALPPEVNSGRMYAGPGSAHLVAAASAWNGLAVELGSVATGYDTVITALSSDEWLGPASALMADAVAPFVAWLNAAAVKAEEAATQARAAAAAFEAAFAAVVPPPLIAANRAQLARLIAANVFGQNTSAIAATEAQYGEMWAQDAAAMYGYAGSSASASAVTPFTAPPQTTSPAASALQAGAVSEAVATSAGTAQSTLSQLISGGPTVLQGLTSPISSALVHFASSDSPWSWLWQLLFGTSTFPTSISALLTDLQPYASFLYNTEGLPYFSIGMGNNFVQSAKTLGLLPAAAAPAAAAAAGDAAKGLSGLGGLLGGGQVTAGLGDAASLGRLSVPPSWAAATGPGLSSGTAPVPISTVNGVPEAGGSGNLLGGMPLAGAGSGMGGSGPRYGFRPTVMPRPPFAG
ncbi:PPE family protein PPE26 [Mycobacterium simulans]|uniref:PPE family protein n=1 Tax=Mycobacterium simulans TaxID=627089 RepID=UPI00174BEEBE|nr:PPE family protein [Mycobacterium simulans]SON62954.1 PPE family protein PPE26 [Mycobacterium simulans]